MYTTMTVVGKNAMKRCIDSRAAMIPQIARVTNRACKEQVQGRRERASESNVPSNAYEKQGDKQAKEPATLGKIVGFEIERR